jgi:ketosteroid isomerase-like protein
MSDWGSGLALRLSGSFFTLALSALLVQGCAVQAPPTPVAASAAPSASCVEGFDEASTLEIAKRHRKLLLALNAGQVDQALALYAPDAIVVAPSREQISYRGPAWVRLYLQEQLLAHGARFETEDLFNGVGSHCDVQVYGGQYHLTLNGEKQWRPYLIVWRRMNSEWLVIAHHLDLASR